MKVFLKACMEGLLSNEGFVNYFREDAKGKVGVTFLLLFFPQISGFQISVSSTPSTQST
jgi:hypothetical protein